MDRTPVLSVVTPVYNEEAVLHLTIDRLRRVMDGIGEAYEVILVDDGSQDRSNEIIRGLQIGWPQLRLIQLQRNSGHQAALAAGLQRALGQYVVSIDADLQDPPEKIPEMLALARAEGLHVVYGVRADRTTDALFKKTTAGLYYWLMRRYVGSWVPSQAGDFRLISRDVVNALTELPEQKPVYRLVVPALGFSSGEVPYVRAERAAGTTKYPLSKMIALAVDSLTRFSAMPLRIATWLGAIGFLACLALVAYSIVSYARGVVVPGWTSMFLAVLLLGAIQLVCIGLLGEYIARIYAHLLQRPQFRISYDSVAQPDQPAQLVQPDHNNPVGTLVG
ncbi:glycosyltransferase family 2 protein [Dactylosporangium sp. NPDC000555]|uniref:glycosyltransferase family 2 protein n=1 Tax=Dactylosporangium sp. NPDC000555 TaxID=3154260 RepID=UPI0033235A50